MRLTSFEKGYVSGIIDAEGCIGLNKIRVGNTDRSFIENLHKILGGHIYLFKTSVNRDFWVLQIASIKEIQDILKQIIPFLVIKRQRAVESLTFIKGRVPKPRKPFVESEDRFIADHYKDMSDREIAHLLKRPQMSVAVRRLYHLKLRKLNRKGREVKGD